MLLKSRYVIPVTSNFIEDGAIFIKGDRIIEVGPFADLHEKYPAEPVKDYKLAALMPGLINTHTHLSYSVFRGLFEDMPYVEWKRKCLRTEPLLSDQERQDSARLGALESIASGVTTVADFSPTGESVPALDESGLRSVMYLITSTMHKKYAAEVVEDSYKKIDAFKANYNKSRISYGLGVGHTYACHPQVYTEIARAVGNTDMRVAMHLAGTKEEFNFVRHGSSSLSIHASKINQGLKLAEFGYFPWLPTGTTPVRYVYNWSLFNVPNLLIIHGIHVDKSDIKFMSKSNVSVAFCPRINAKLGMGYSPVSEYLSSGITVGLGTDSPAAVSTTDMIAEMCFGLMITRAKEGSNSSNSRYMTGQKMLEMATIDAAKALKLDAEIGSLEAGKKADIIAVSLQNSHQVPTTDPVGAVIYTANQDNVKMTMVDGNILYDSFSHVNNLNRNDIVEKVRKTRKRLREHLYDDTYLQARIKEYNRDLTERFKR